MPKNTPPKKNGRPTIFTPEIGDLICERLSEGESMRTICKADDMPAARTVYYWLRNNPDFLAQYNIAKEESADALIEEMLDIADDGTNDYMTITKGNYEYNVENREVTNRSKLRVDTRKWIASKLKPKKYGEKVDVTSDGKAIQGNTIIFTDFSGDEAES